MPSPEVTRENHYQETLNRAYDKGCTDTLAKIDPAARAMLTSLANAYGLLGMNRSAKCEREAVREIIAAAITQAEAAGIKVQS